jgi:hypothetical protein
MKSISIFVFLSSLLQLSSHAFGVEPGRPVERNLWIIDSKTKDQFETQKLPWFTAALKNCKLCRLQNLTPYDSEGRMDRNQLVTQLGNLPTSGGVLLVAMNPISNKMDAEIVALLKKWIERGIAVVGPAGFAKTNEAIPPLSQTWLGKTPGSLIVADLERLEKLIQGQSFGPQLFTAIKTLDEQGQSITGAEQLAIRILPKELSAEKLLALSSKRFTLKKIWPSLDDLLGKAPVEIRSPSTIEQ